MTRKDYRIYRTCEADFDRAAAELADRIATSGENAVRIVFFGDTTDNDDYIERRDTICRICAERFGEGGPLVGFIAQKPLRSSLAAEVTILMEPAKIVRSVRVAAKNLKKTEEFAKNDFQNRKLYAIIL